MRNRRIYISGRRHNQFRTKTPRISTCRHADRFLKNRRRYLYSNTHHGYTSAKTVPQHEIANRRHQNYQNSIVTGSKSSGIDLPFLGIFGLLQILGIFFIANTPNTNTYLHANTSSMVRFFLKQIGVFNPFLWLW